LDDCSDVGDFYFCVGYVVCVAAVADFVGLADDCDVVLGGVAEGLLQDLAGDFEEDLFAGRGVYAEV
jgi:hypothetical protein